MSDPAQKRGRRMENLVNWRPVDWVRIQFVLFQDMAMRM
jgi:hypothetical protein